MEEGQKVYHQKEHYFNKLPHTMHFTGGEYRLKVKEIEVFQLQTL